MKLLTLLFTLFVCLVFMPMQTFANQGTTSNTGTGVVIKEENGVRYLTTTIIEDSTAAAEASSSSKTPPISQSLLFALNFTGDIEPPPGFFTDLTALFNRVIRIVLAVSSLLAFAYLIWGGFQWITSGGDKSKIDKARNTIISAIVGLLIVASSYAILLLVLNFLGYKDLNDVLDQANGATNVLN